jgi:hypothetical protein
MIGNDPRYQAIIDAYKAGQLQTTAPQYNPIYDIRREQIEAGELPPGSRFPNPQLPTQPPAEDTPEEPFDPCPPGYQLIDGVCQPDTYVSIKAVEMVEYQRHLLKVQTMSDIYLAMAR